LWLHSLKVAQLLRNAACLHTNQSRSYLNHLVYREKLLFRQICNTPTNLICSDVDILVSKLEPLDMSSALRLYLEVLYELLF